MNAQHIAAALLLTFVSAPSILAAEGKLEFQASDTVGTVLERHIGKVVELRLKSGEKISGKVEVVGAQLVHLSQITGAEFYDAVVVLDDIGAVTVRVRK